MTDTANRVKKIVAEHLGVEESKVTDTASFTNYSTGGFTLQDQVDLADCARKATLKGIVTIISNHDTPFTRKLYSGAKIVELKVQRSIGCKGKSRIKEKEILAIFQ